MDVSQTIDSFWNNFGLIAYEENSVPTGDNAPELPYITYTFNESGFSEESSMSGSIYYRSTNWEDITLKAKQIDDFIGMGGIVIGTDNGAIWIKKGTPFSQRMNDLDDTIRRIYINITVEFLTNN